MFVLAVVLRFDQGTDHSQQHGDGDDQHGRRLSHTQLAVQGGQGAPGLLSGSATDDVLVVLHVQVSNVQDLAKDALQLAVTGPGV